MFSSISRLLYEVLGYYLVLGYYCGEVQEQEERLTGHLVGLKKWLSLQQIFGQHSVREGPFGIFDWNADDRNLGERAATSDSDFSTANGDPLHLE